MDNILMNFSAIQHKMDELFYEIPDDIQLDLSDLKLKKSTLSADDLYKVESNLKIKLPNIFKQTISKYDFGDLTLGEVWFASKENYADYLIKVNTNQIKDEAKGAHFASWWGNGERLAKYIMIGGSDGYIVLLNIETEKILAYSRTESYKSSEIVASNFEKFVQATATVYISMQKEVIDDEITELPSIVGSNINSGFWKELIRI